METKESDHDKTIKSLFKIFKKLLENLDEAEKYGNLNAERIRKKFNKHKSMIQILFDAGFKESNDQKRLIWKYNDANITLLIDNYDSLKAEIEKKDIEKSNQEMLNIKSNHSSIFPLHEETLSCEIAECLCLKIIGKALLLYNTYLSHPPTSNKNGSLYQHVFNQIGNKYTPVDLLDDFNHLLSKHSNEFEYIYNKLAKRIYANEPCVLKQCQFMQRNQRDRQRVHVLSALYLNNDDIVLQQILDRIHCFYFHTLDVGYKLTKQETDEIEKKSSANNFSVINSYLKSKQKNYRDINGLNRLNSTLNKFQVDEKQCSQNECEKYSYGHRFYYWQNFKDDHSSWEWYARPTQKPLSLKLTPYDRHNWQIKQKYKDLKEELTNNEICVISESQFINLIDLAEFHIKSNKVKTLFCERKGDSAICYDRMIYGRLMALGHLVSLMVYCNYDTLQMRFSETFRKIHPDEADESLKQRHCNYFFLARSLRECVECFGMNHQGTGNITVFHGINRHFYFHSVDAYIKGPFSGTTDAAAAINFCGGSGMLLELYISPKGWIIDNEDNEQRDYVNDLWCSDFWNNIVADTNAIYRLNCMDMSWISDFVNEQEIFCIGGLKKIQYRTIIDVALNQNYEAYIAGLRALTQCIMSEYIEVDYGYRVDPTKKDIQMAFRLLSHELFKCTPNHPNSIELKGCSKYMERVFHLQCLNTLGIQTESTGSASAIIHNLFKDQQNGWIDLALITTIFPNIKHISYNAESKSIEWLTQPTIYQSVLQFLRRNKQTTLDSIWIEFDCKYNDDVNKIIATLQLQYAFKESSWLIEIKKHVGETTNDVDSWNEMANFSLSFNAAMGINEKPGYANQIHNQIRMVMNNYTPSNIQMHKIKE